MTKFEEFAAAWTDAFPSNPFDPASITDAARKSAETTGALAATALKAVEKCTEQTGKWTLESLGRAKQAVAVQQNPADFAKTAKELTSASVESAAEHLAAYTEIAKQTQIESAEIMLGAAK